MAVKLDQIVDMIDLEDAIATGYVNRRFHDEFPELAILNYSDKCQFDGVWTPTTKACRGLIYNTQTNDVLARPFGKFFNYGDETNGVAISPDTPLVGVFDKMDGSLGIGYMRPDGKQAIATRGSFHSEQAEHATALFRNPYMALISGHHTPLYEILYPENRIVVDYGDRDELVFLGTVEIATGEYLWGTVRSFPYRTVREALEAEPRPNAEGMVMWLNWSTPVKIKQEDYKALHKIISGLSQKEVWRQLSAGTYEEWVKGLPDEFYEWAEDTAWGFRATVGNRGGEIQREYESLMLSIWHDFPFVNDYPSREDKKRFALEAVKSPNKSYLFTLFDGGSIAPALWKSIEPKGI